eukprot:2038029-Pyramimonas_sp.AAC.1
MAERKIPAFVFKSQQYPKYFKDLHAAEQDMLRSRGTDGDVHEEWAAAKRAMVSAAKATRNHMIALADLQN